MCLGIAALLSLGSHCSTRSICSVSPLLSSLPASSNASASQEKVANVKLNLMWLFKKAVHKIFVTWVIKLFVNCPDIT